MIITYGKYVSNGPMAEDVVSVNFRLCRMAFGCVTESVFSTIAIFYLNDFYLDFLVCMLLVSMGARGALRCLGFFDFLILVTFGHHVYCKRFEILSLP